MDNHTIVIGGGLFGLTTSIVLAENGIKVTVLEKNLDILKEASLVNQNRIHYGYHYPRSIETGQESIDGMEDFLSYYGDCVNNSLIKYYAISKKRSHTSVDEFIKFSKKLNIPLEESWPDEKFLNRDLIQQCWKAHEPNFDYQTLRVNILNRINKLKNIKILRNSKIIKIDSFYDNQVQVTLRNGYEIKGNNLVNATYSGLNDIFKLATKKNMEAKFQLVVLPILKINKKIPTYGLTIMDGPFCSILPRGFSKDEYILSNVKGSVLESKTGFKKPTWKEFSGSVERDIVEKCKTYFPILSEMEIVDSWITTKMLLPNQEKNDSRPTLILTHKKNIYSIFSGKVTTCVRVAKDMLKKIEVNHE